MPKHLTWLCLNTSQCTWINLIDDSTLIDSPVLHRSWVQHHSLSHMFHQHRLKEVLFPTHPTCTLSTYYTSIQIPDKFGLKEIHCMINMTYLRNNLDKIIRWNQKRIYQGLLSHITIALSLLYHPCFFQNNTWTWKGKVDDFIRTVT